MNRLLDDNEIKEWYDHKLKIFILDPNERGKETFDKVGRINY